MKGNRVRVRWRVFLASGVLCFLSISAASASEGAAVVNRLHDSLLSVMKEAEVLGYEGRYRRLDPVVRSTYDLPYVARLTLGKHWRTLTEQDRAMFVAAFSRLSISTYARQFNGYSGEQFRTVSEESFQRGGLLVETVLVKSNGNRVHLNYLLRGTNGRWRVVNVIAEGVSDLALKRSQYTSVIRREGFPELLRRIEAKIDEHSRKK